MRLSIYLSDAAIYLSIWCGYLSIYLYSMWNNVTHTIYTDMYVYNVSVAGRQRHAKAIPPLLLLHQFVTLVVLRCHGDHKMTSLSKMLWNKTSDPSFPPGARNLYIYTIVSIGLDWLVFLWNVPHFFPFFLLIVCFDLSSSLFGFSKALGLGNYKYHLPRTTSRGIGQTAPGKLGCPRSRSESLSSYCFY